MEDKDFYLMVERHEEKIKTLERDVTALREVQSEIRAMNETLVTLATELKHTNAHLARHERRIDEMEAEPKNRWNQLVMAGIGAVAGAAISAIFALLF
jgi:hypothetical protein